MSEGLALVDRPTAALVAQVTITNDQIDLIRKTIAPDATEPELQLFFYDCKRRGVHPLDKLIHFTKRKGKYTPVTSIDFLRSRAAGTKEHVGTDDAVFDGTIEGGDLQASVTVYRLVQGDRYPFTATARWAEYCPTDGNDFMWKKMPRGQLSKCAEGLALRKGFPQELDGLYTFEEMDQAGGDEPRQPDTRRPQRASETKAAGSGQTAKAAAPVAGQLVADPCTIKAVTEKPRQGHDPVFWIDTTDGQRYSTFSKTDAAELKSFAGTDHQVRITYVEKQSGNKTYRNFLSVSVVEPTAAAPATAPSSSPAVASQPELTDADFGDFK